MSDGATMATVSGKRNTAERDWRLYGPVYGYPIGLRARVAMLRSYGLSWRTVAEDVAAMSGGEVRASASQLRRWYGPPSR